MLELYAILDLKSKSGHGPVVIHSLIHSLLPLAIGPNTLLIVHPADKIQGQMVVAYFNLLHIENDINGRVG
jgi:hypothetical protein